ncbi:helix-turn-helix domain-containing protein [Frankia sp. AiPs1]|uniref:helix-turn-helix domain-containing protein n=1 Tax=Frankia sp. AiPs1 TaxID=573493 RepID=UPI002042F8FD|nr:helix-turn-helix domain-containing protein [Frankia sp. AiPs1]MCM3921724.1 helix-turn-helix domain-containing protein [Frankia sp. AiPs1]
MDDDTLDHYLVANSFEEGPAPDLPWSHLTKPGFVLVKKAYGRYWGDFLDPTAHQVFKAIMYHMNYETGACFPSRPTVAKAVKYRGKPVSEKTISRKIHELENVGLLEIVKPVRGNGPFVNPRYRAGGRTNRYVVNYDRLAAADGDGVVADAQRTTHFFLTMNGRVSLPPDHPWIMHETPKQMKARLTLLRPGIMEPDPELFGLPEPGETIKPLKSHKHRPDVQEDAALLAQIFLEKAFEVTPRADKVPVREEKVKDLFAHLLGGTTVECTLDHLHCMIDIFFEEFPLSGRPNADLWRQFERQTARLFSLAQEELQEELSEPAA